MRDTEVQVTSLVSGDFGSGRWSGGRATATDAWYEYRTAEGKRGKFTVIEAHVVWQDTDDQPHDVRYGVGSGEYGCIREEPSNDSAEAERGYGLSGRNGKQFRVSADSEFGQLLVSLYTNGVPESRVGNDIRGVIGVEAELVERPHHGIKQGETDRYPMLLASDVYEVRKGKVTAKGDEPQTRSGAVASNGKPEQRARELVLVAIQQGEGTTTASDVIRAAAKALRGDPDRKDILGLLGDDEWLEGQKEWAYKKRTGEIMT